MKRIIALLLVLAVVIAMAVPVAACGAGSAWWRWWIWWDTPDEPSATEPVEPVIGIPEITDAAYTHRTPYYGMHKHLTVTWTAVDGADSYEVEVIKADGVVLSYVETDEQLYLADVECPRVYIEETSTWAAASVRVRAVVGDDVGEWSNAVKIGCDTLH